jgi:drug/metabolite transporter (DMT)-like permease
MSTSDGRSSSVQAYALVALAGLCWSGNHVLGRAIAGHVPPVSLSAFRWVFPCILAGLLARGHLARDWPEIKSHWKALLILGLSGGALFSALQYVGLQYTSAINVSVLNSLGPVFIVAAVAILFGETMRPIQLAGIAVSLGGVLFIVTRGEPTMLAQMSFNYGDLIILFNMAVWAFYSAWLRFRPRIHWTSFMFVFTDRRGRHAAFCCLRARSGLPLPADRDDVPRDDLCFDLPEHHRVPVMEPRCGADWTEPGGCLPAFDRAL